MNIFDCQTYREVLQTYLHSLPNEGFGELAKIAKALQVHPSLITVILKGQKDLSIEQANDLSEYLGFGELETDFFLTMVQLERAGRPNLKDRFKRQLAKLKEQSRELKDRLPNRQEMPPEAKAIFYSEWYYSGLRMMCSLPGPKSVELLSKQLQLPKNVVARTIRFLLEHGLLVEEDSSYRLGPNRIHISANDPLVYRHHTNWRQKAIARFPNMYADELHFTGPLTIAKADAEKVRKILLQNIDEVFKVVDPSPEEEAFCLNIDWFRF